VTSRRTEAVEIVKVLECRTLPHRRDPARSSTIRMLVPRTKRSGRPCPFATSSRTQRKSMQTAGSQVGPAMKKTVTNKGWLFVLPVVPAGRVHAIVPLMTVGQLSVQNPSRERPSSGRACGGSRRCCAPNGSRRTLRQLLFTGSSSSWSALGLIIALSCRAKGLGFRLPRPNGTAALIRGTSGAMWNSWRCLYRPTWPRADASNASSRVSRLGCPCIRSC